MFIVGMPRSGTTLVEQILDSHHQMYGAGEFGLLDEIIQKEWKRSKQPFATWVNQLTEKEFQFLGDTYLNQIAKLAKGSAYIIDKMPSNFFYLGLIYRMFSHAKLFMSCVIQWTLAFLVLRIYLKKG